MRYPVGPKVNSVRNNGPELVEPVPEAAPTAGTVEVAVTDAPPKSNDPCWCGSGRKYKRCHKASDGGVAGRTSVADGAAAHPATPAATTQPGAARASRAHGGRCRPRSPGPTTR